MNDVHIRDDVLAAHLQDETVLLDLHTKRYFHLNATAARIWKGLEDRLEPEQIVSSLLQDFVVDAATARAETQRVLGTFRTEGLLA